MIRRPPRSTLFPTRRSSDLDPAAPRARTTLMTRGGIVGSELPRLRAEVISLTPGDTLIFATDGIKDGFSDGLPARSEEHTSELQSRLHLVCRLLLGKKKTTT